MTDEDGNEYGIRPLHLLRLKGVMELLLAIEVDTDGAPITVESAADEMGLSEGTARDRLSAMESENLVEPTPIIDSNGQPRKAFKPTEKMVALSVRVNQAVEVIDAWEGLGSNNEGSNVSPDDLPDDVGTTMHAEVDP